MAKKTTSIDIVKNLNAFDIKKLTREEKIKLIASSSKTLYDRYKRLKSSGLESPYLRKMVDRPKRYLTRSLKKMTDTNLEKKLTDLSLKARNKTSSIKGTKQFLKEFKAKTGADYSSIDSATWAEIRKKIESDYHSSEEIIKAYSEADTIDEDEIDKRLNEADMLDAVNTDIEDIEPLDDYANEDDLLDAINTKI